MTRIDATQLMHSRHVACRAESFYAMHAHRGAALTRMNRYLLQRLHFRWNTTISEKQAPTLQLRCMRGILRNCTTRNMFENGNPNVTSIGGTRLIHSKSPHYTSHFERSYAALHTLHNTFHAHSLLLGKRLRFPLTLGGGLNARSPLRFKTQQIILYA